MTTSTPGVPTPATIVNPVARFDRLPVTRFQIAWICLLGLGYLIETYDNVVFAFLAPSIRAEWGLSIAKVGLVTSAVFIGMMIGAVGGGRLSDLFGRRPVLICASVFYSMTSLMSALAPNYETLLISRILTGIGVQAATGVIMVYVSEMFPSNSRGRFFTVLTLFGTVGGPITSFTALAITSNGIGSWRWVFAIGSIGFLIAIAVALWLPETVRWLNQHRRIDKANSVVILVEGAALRRGELRPVESAPTEVPQGSFRNLFKPQYARRLTVLGVGFGLLVFCVYGFQSWLPTVLVGRGMPRAEALRIASIASLGALAAPLILFVVADRIERKTAIVIEGILAGSGLLLLGMATDPGATLAAAMLVSLPLTAATTSFYTYLPEVFPTEVRGVGAGVINGIGRVAGILSGIVVAAVYAGFGDAPLYFGLGVGLFLMGGIVVAFGPRTSRQSLEAISQE